MRLNEGSLTPLYQQLMEDIKYAIEDGKYQPEEKIPSEPELSELYSVSRITVRRAVDELCAQGYLVKKQGKGTFVGRAKLQRKLPGNNTMSFTDVCRLNGKVHSVRMLTCQEVPARQDEIKFLNLEPGSKLLYIQRLHMADGVPIQLENNFYPLHRFAFLRQEDLEHNSLLQILRERHGINTCNTSDTTVEIVRASPEYAQLLDVPVGEPLFYMNIYFLDYNGQPLFVGRQYIVGKRYVLHI